MRSVARRSMTPRLIRLRSFAMKRAPFIRSRSFFPVGLRVRRRGRMPVRDADPRAGPGHLRHAVLPRPLGLAPGDQEISPAKEERQRSTTSLRPQQELARFAQADKGNDWTVE